MAKRRTRKDKVTAQHEYTYRLEAETVIVPVDKPTDGKVRGQMARDPALELGFNPRLIRMDMLKTAVVCGIVLGVELGVYLYLLG